MKKTAWIVVAGLLAAVALILQPWDSAYVPRPLPPARPSSQHAATVMVPTLDSPIPKGRSALWCAPFQLAWNRLRDDAVKEPVRIHGVEALSKALNESKLQDSDLVPGSFYAAAGFAKDGILEHIRREMGEKFPGVTPTLDPVPDLDIAAYAYLAASLRFKHAYREQKDGVQFVDGDGRRHLVRGFGVRPSDKSSYRDVYLQPAILHVGEGDPPTEYIVDLDPKSSPHQIILAMRPRPATLTEAVDWVQAKSGPGTGFSGGETLLVPDVAIGIVHRFRELEGRDKLFLNRGREENYIALAQQSVQFRLDRGGAELRAEAQIMVGVKSAMPRRAPQLLFDRPFLLLMKKRDAAQPYLAVWIDNPEILDAR